MAAIVMIVTMVMFYSYNGLLSQGMDPVPCVYLLIHTIECSDVVCQCISCLSVYSWSDQG